jgi:hypothetical protein
MVCARYFRLASSLAFFSGIFPMLSIIIYQATYQMDASDLGPGYFVTIAAWIASWFNAALMFYYRHSDE